MTDYNKPSLELRARVALDKQAFRHSHALGQNFLLDEALLNGLLDLAGVIEGDRVLEIGPGPGLMTALMARRGARVKAVELDRGLEPVLKDVLLDAEGVELVWQDILKADLRAMMGEGSYRVVANLPYYITADILLRLTTADPAPESIAIMVQREAAERVMSSPGQKQWCALAATVQSYGTARVLAEIPAEAFNPQPHVQSDFILIERHPHPVVEPRDVKLYRRVIAAAFAMRRKTLLNNLKAAFALDQSAARAVLDGAGVDPGIRGEALSLEALCRVSDALTEQIGSQ